MEKTSNHFILILCGGSGPRLWPLSRATKPKQFLSVFGNKTLVESTYERFLGIVPKQNIFFVSNQKYLAQLKQIFGNKVSRNNFIAEPSKKNTAMAIILGASVINKINQNAIISATPSDHFIGKLPQFNKDMALSYKLASNFNSIVTIGIKATSPNPAYGYILPLHKVNQFFPVNKFIEKPSSIDANLLLKKNAVWNSGIYTFSIKTLLTQFSTYQPEYTIIFDKLLKSLKNINSVYKTSPTLPIDKAISEKSHELLMVPARFSWSDIGQWQSIWEQLSKNKEGICSINNQSQFVSVNSSNCLISSNHKKLIGLVGVNNLAIIDTPDSTLICNLNDSYSVRDLITKIVDTPKLKKYFLRDYD